jgi:hypothetical protein
MRKIVPKLYELDYQYLSTNSDSNYRDKPDGEVATISKVGGKLARTKSPTSDEYQNDQTINNYWWSRTLNGKRMVCAKITKKQLVESGETLGGAAKGLFSTAANALATGNFRDQIQPLADYDKYLKANQQSKIDRYNKKKEKEKERTKPEDQQNLNDPPQGTTFYMSKPPSTVNIVNSATYQAFSIANSTQQLDPSTSCYKFVVTAPGKAKFSTVDTPTFFQQATQNPNLVINPVCQVQNTWTNTMTHLVTVTPGNAQKFKDMWLVLKKAIVKWESQQNPPTP